MCLLVYFVNVNAPPISNKCKQILVSNHIMCTSGVNSSLLLLLCEGKLVKLTILDVHELLLCVALIELMFSFSKLRTE